LSNEPRGTSYNHTIKPTLESGQCVTCLKRAKFIHEYTYRTFTGSEVTARRMLCDEHARRSAAAHRVTIKGGFANP